jgi:hypothetical protein
MADHDHKKPLPFDHKLISTSGFEACSLRLHSCFSKIIFNIISNYEVLLVALTDQAR